MPDGFIPVSIGGKPHYIPIYDDQGTVIPDGLKAAGIQMPKDVNQHAKEVDEPGGTLSEIFAKLEKEGLGRLKL